MFKHDVMTCQSFEECSKQIPKVGKLPPAMSVAGISAPSASLPIQVVRWFGKNEQVMTNLKIFQPLLLF